MAHHQSIGTLYVLPKKNQLSLFVTVLKLKPKKFKENNHQVKFI